MLRAVCFLPLQWSLPFIAASAALMLRHITPTVALFMAQHPSFAPGVQHLCRGMCNVLLLVSGQQQANGTQPHLSASGLAGHELAPGTAPAHQLLHPICRDLTPRWLAAFSLSVGGVLLPLYLVHVVFERNLLPYMHRLLGGRAVGHSTGGGGGVAGVTLDALLVFVLVHAPLLWVVTMGLIIWLIAAMPQQ